MNVYYYEGSPIVAPFTITSNQPMFDIEKADLSRERSTQSSQRWELSFGVTVADSSQANLMVAAVNQLASSSTMIMPQLNTSEIDANADAFLEIGGAASPGVTSISIVPKTVSSERAIMPAGYFFKFSNHDKIYMTTAEKRTSENSLSFYPALRTAISGANSILHGDAAVITYYKDDSNLKGISFTDGVLVNPGIIRLLEDV